MPGNTRRPMKRERGGITASATPDMRLISFFAAASPEISRTVSPCAAAKPAAASAVPRTTTVSPRPSAAPVCGAPSRPVTVTSRSPGQAERSSPRPDRPTSADSAPTRSLNTSEASWYCSTSVSA